LRHIRLVALEGSIIANQQGAAYSFITCEIDRTIVVITLNRPDKLNAYTGAMERKTL
jgi:hypothetical protein